MKKVLIVVDMQNDFITGSLGSEAAQAIVPAVKAKIEHYINTGGLVIFTRDTHNEDYLGTQEGKNLPVVHCVYGSDGWKIADGLYRDGCYTFDKATFGSLTLVDEIKKYTADDQIESIEFVGLCSAICVVSNALIFKAQLPEAEIIVDASCCACVSPETHRAAMIVMKTCQVNVINLDT